MNAIEAKIVLMESLLETEDSSTAPKSEEEIKEIPIPNNSLYDEIRQLHRASEDKKVQPEIIKKPNFLSTPAKVLPTSMKLHKNEVASIHKILAEELSQIVADRSIEKFGGKSGDMFK